MTALKTLYGIIFVLIWSVVGWMKEVAKCNHCIMPYTVGRCIRRLTVDGFKSHTVRGADMMR